MALEVASGIVTISTGAVNTTFTISGLTFQPKAILFVWNMKSGVGIAEADLSAGIGFATSTSARRAYAIEIDHALAANSNRDSVWRNDCCITTLTTAAAVGGHADLDAITSDGFRLIIDDVFPSAMDVGWIAYGGSDITDVAIVDWTERTTTGDTDVPTGFALNTGIDDKAVIALGLRSTAAAGTAASDATLAVAIAAGNTIVNAVCAMSGDDATDPSLTCQYACTGDFIASVGNDAVVSRSTVSAWLADGFRVNTAETDGSAYRRSALVMKGGRWQVGDFTTATNTNNTLETTTYPPKSIFAISGGIAQSASDTTTAAAEMSIGVATGPAARWAFYWRDADAAGSSDAAHAYTNAQFYYNGAATAATEDGTCDLVNFTADPGRGFTWVMDNADTSGAWVGYLIGSDTPVPKSSSPTKMGPFRPPQRGTGSQFVTVSTAFSVTVPLATLTLTAFAPLVKTPRTVIPPLGTLTLTAFAPTIRLNKIVQPPLGTLTLTAFAPTVLTPRTVIPPLGTLALTAFAPTVKIGINVAIPLGTLTLSAFAPTVLTPRVVAPPLATLTLTGFAPTVTAGGGAAPIVASSLPTRLGPFWRPQRALGSKTNYDASVLISVPVGTLTLTGFAPAAVMSVKVGRPRGVGPFYFLFKRGTGSTYVQRNRVDVPLGTLTLTAFAPTVKTTATLPIPLGTLTLTAFAPTVRVGATIQIPLATLTLTKFAPTVLANVKVLPPLGTLTLTAFAPVVRTPRLVLPPLGTLTLTAFAPTVTSAAAPVVSVPLGVLTLVGFAPSVSGSSGVGGGGGGGSSTGGYVPMSATIGLRKPRRRKEDEPAAQAVAVEIETTLSQESVAAAAASVAALDAAIARTQKALEKAQQTKSLRADVAALRTELQALEQQRRIQIEEREAFEVLIQILSDE